MPGKVIVVGIVVQAEREVAGLRFPGKDADAVTQIHQPGQLLFERSGIHAVIQMQVNRNKIVVFFDVHVKFIVQGQPLCQVDKPSALLQLVRSGDIRTVLLYLPEKFLTAFQIVGRVFRSFPQRPDPDQSGGSAWKRSAFPLMPLPFSFAFFTGRRSPAGILLSTAAAAGAFAPGAPGGKQKRRAGGNPTQRKKQSFHAHRRQKQNGKNRPLQGPVKCRIMFSRRGLWPLCRWFGTCAGLRVVETRKLPHFCFP